MSYSEPNGSHSGASNKTSRIPRLVISSIKDIPIHYNNKYDKKLVHKLTDLNLNQNKSRIPIKKRRTTQTANILIKAQTSGSETGSQDSQNKIDSTLSDSNRTESKEHDCKVKLRSVRGRSGLTYTPNGTKSEPIDCIDLKAVLEIVRSNLSADNKFKAIKSYRDKRLLGLISEMETHNDINCDDRVREWVDSGYISNSNSIREPEDVFASNESKSGAAVDAPVLLRHSQQLWSRRRNYNMRAMDLIALNNKYNSFNSDISMSSISSIESLLESRRQDPQELLLALGFGYASEEQLLNRIPQRFLESPSSAKGVNAEIIRKSYGLVDVSSLSSSASFSPTDTRERSFSCGPFSERIRKRMNSKESLMKQDLPEIITSSPSMFQMSESILNPANRRFLESQGKQEDQNHLGSKRLIIGTKSYKLDCDGDPLAFPKTPSPVATTPVQIDNQMDVSENSKEQISSNTIDNIFRRKQLQRQKGFTDQDLDFYKLNQSSSMTDMSSELSSSTTTLVETVISTTNDSSNQSAANDSFVNWCENTTLSSDKCNAFSQTDNQLTQEFSDNETVEAAFVVAIQSLRLSLEFYKLQSLKMAELSEQKYKESSRHFTEEDNNRLSNIHQLRENIQQELIGMDTLLNRHLSLLKTSNGLEKSFISQAHIFTEAAKKMTQLLKEQQNIYSLMDFVETE